MILLKMYSVYLSFSFGFYHYKMSFLESALFKNLFQIICILDFAHFCCVISFSSSSFPAFSCESISFVGLAKVMGQGGRDFTFQSSLSSLAVSPISPCRKINLEARIFESSRLEGLLGLLGLLEGGWNNVV